MPCTSICRMALTTASAVATTAMASAKGNMPVESQTVSWRPPGRQLSASRSRTDKMRFGLISTRWRPQCCQSQIFRLGQTSSLDVAKSSNQEFTPGQFVKQSDYVYFRRLTDKSLLVHTGRGKYKLYHPLFRLFLQGLRP